MAGVYLAPETVYRKGNPSGTQDLIKLYGLGDLAASVARSDPVTGAKRKLRKSYKNHIADLAGRHAIPTKENTPWSLIEVARMPPVHNLEILPLPQDLLNEIKFEQSPSTGVQGFDSRLLATYNPQDGYPEIATSAASPRGGEKKKRRENGATPAEKRRKLSVH